MSRMTDKEEFLRDLRRETNECCRTLTMHVPGNDENIDQYTRSSLPVVREVLRRLSELGRALRYAEEGRLLSPEECADLSSSLNVLTGEVTHFAHELLAGVLIHTKAAFNKYAYAYTDLKHIPHDSNLTITCMLRTLLKHQDILGKELFIQLDNCYRENKNRYVLSFCALLVQLKIFRKVIMHFMPVGHTHEDVDQMFSCIARALRKQNTYTFEDLRSFIKSSFTPAIDVEEIEYNLDVKEWLKPHLAGNFANHSQPLWFEFTLVDGEARMRYKMWHPDPWEPNGPGLLCLKATPDLTECPKWVEPCVDRTDLPSLMKDIPAKYGDRIPSNKKDDLKSFLCHIANLEELPPQVQTWDMLELLKVAERREAVQQVSQNLEPLRERVEQRCSVVTIGKQGKDLQSKDVQEVDDFSTVKSGDIAAVNLIDTTKRPYLGTVVKVHEDDVSISWLKGSWTGEWKQWTCGSGPSLQPYTSTIPKQSLLLWGFALTYKKRLPKKIVLELKERYASIDEESELNN